MNDTLRSLSARFRTITALTHIMFFRTKDAGALSHGLFPVIEYVIKNDGCTQKDVASSLRISAPAASAAVKRLEKRALLTRCPDSKNLRCNRLFATEKGKTLFEKCAVEFQKINRLVFDGFEGAELEALKSYLDRIIKNLSGGEFSHENLAALIKKEKKLKSKSTKGGKDA